MKAIRDVRLGVFSAAILLAMQSSGRAQFELEGLSPTDQTLRADIIVVGKVTAIEPNAVLVERRPGADKVAHMVATIRIDESLLGAKGLTHVRVGFVPEIGTVYPNAQFKVFT